MNDLSADLDGLRSGEDGKHKRVCERFLHLITDGHSELRGIQYLALSDSVDRLAKNSVQADDVEKFITDELRRAKRDYGRELSDDILVPSSTNATRKKRGQPPHSPIQRNDATIYERHKPTKASILEVGGRKPPRTTPAELDEVDLRSALNLSDEEEQLLELLQAGYSQREAADKLEIERSCVRRMLKRLQQRAERLGYSI